MADETQRKVSVAWPAALHRGFFLLPSSFLFFSLHRDSIMRQDVELFFAFFSLYVRCQHVSGGQKSPHFCHIRIEDILSLKYESCFIYIIYNTSFYLVILAISLVTKKRIQV